MNNIIAYYYSLHPKEISHINDKYFFEYNDCNYVFMIYDRPLSDLSAIFKINKEMINRNILVHEIILNNEKEVLTYVSNKPYILMEIFINKEARITLPEICYINNSSISIDCNKIINRQDWVSLWEAKNDYFEVQINEIREKYPNLCNYANYYIGLAENAISYVRIIMNIKEEALSSICHKRIHSKDTLFSLYNPLNYVCDYRIRDICEYVKSSFFEGDDAYKIVEEYFLNNYISYKEALLFYGRLLYPSYFFDLHDDIVNNNLDETLIEKIIIKSNSYEKFLFDIYIYLTKLYKRYVPGIDWIIKRSL